MRIRRTPRARWLLIGLLMMSSGTKSTSAQSFSSISGYVKDQSKAIVPGVAVSITNDAGLRVWSGVSDENGHYRATQLLPDKYTIQATQPGFKTAIYRVALPVKDNVRVDVDLQFGDRTETVEVTVHAEPTRRTNAQLGTAFEEQLITELPIFGRNTLDLFSLYPGVNMPDKLGEFARDDGGQVNGARNDQQTIELDSMIVNQQELGGPLQSAVPITPDSIRGFVVQTAGFDGYAGRSSGGQVQIVTRAGTNDWHGSVYEHYRTTGTSARNYFANEATPLIRHLPGFAIGGPILRSKLFFFGNYEYHSDRSATLQTRTVPTPEFLNGIVRYRRKDGSLGVLTDGPGSNLESFSGIPGDHWNPGLIGPSGSFEKYRPFSTDSSKTSPSPLDGGVNILNYRYNAPFTRNQNIYISRMDYVINLSNTIYARGTLNDDVRTLMSETFPDYNNQSERVDNSKGFGVNWKSSLTSTLDSTTSFGLTRESYEDSGNQVPNYNPQIFSNLIQTTGAQRQYINTWSISETLNWTKPRHGFQFGFAHRFIDNNLKSFAAVSLPTYGSQANLAANGIGSNSSSGLQRALGDAEYNEVVSPAVVGDAVMVATGSISRLIEGSQFNMSGAQLPAGSPFVRNLLLKEWDFFVQDSFQLKPNLTLTYGLHYSLQTPPYERNGVQMNWTDDLGKRWQEMRDTTKTITAFPLLATQPSGRANGLPDFYETDTNNFAPRVSLAWAIGDTGRLGTFANKGGPVILRAGYALTYDRVGGRLGRDAQLMGSIGLLTTYASPGNMFSFDGLNNFPRAPRIGPGGELPRDSFPVITQPSFVVPSVPAGAGATTTVGIDPHLHSPSNHLLNFTISKQLPGGWIVEGSYIGRFARDLLGQVDLASPPNVRDAATGMTLYQATDELYTRYLEQGVSVSDVQPLAWFENVYPEMKEFVQNRLGTTYSSATQAWYDFMLRQTPASAGPTPGLHTPVSFVDRIADLESGLGQNKLLNPQVQFLGLFGNFARSNYHSAQFTAQKRFSHGVSVSMNYTLSKSMDITSAAEARGNRANGQTGEGLAADALNPGKSYALSDFDRRHQFSGTFVAELPTGRNRWLGGNVGPALNQVIGGWQLSGIVAAASGRPWNFTSNRFNHHFAGRDQPPVTDEIPFELTKLPGRVVVMIPGTAADRARIGMENFKNSHLGGAIARNQARGPGFWNVDFAVTKSFDLSSIRETMRLRFRWETFNLFNHPNFALPGFNPGGGATNIDRGGTLSQIDSTLGAERVMQFAIRLDF